MTMPVLSWHMGMGHCTKDAMSVLVCVFMTALVRVVMVVIFMQVMLRLGLFPLGLVRVRAAHSECCHRGHPQRVSYDARRKRRYYMVVETSM